MSYHDRSMEQRVGRAVLLPFRIILLVVVLAVLLPLIIVSYPFVAIWVIFRVQVPGGWRRRLKVGLLWPLYAIGGVLAMNEFLSLGGLNNPTLSRFTGWLERLFEERKRP